MSTRRAMLVVAAALAFLAGCVGSAPRSVQEQSQRFSEIVDLPPPDLAGSGSLEAALHQRRSQRAYAEAEPPLEVIGQLLWAGQGITDDLGHRTAPSAGARYPLELYAVTAETIAHYLPDGHRIEQRPDRAALAGFGDVAFGQGFVSDAPLVIVISAEVARTEVEYGALAADLVNRESGHAAQNILLQATALELAAVPVGGFDPADVGQLLALPPGHDALYLIPVGFPAVDPPD
ncbi:MAG: SagB/ThcOx family dehydrogenase [Acidimicrobiia bacterium]|nr:SagB/ThcOx family dehydrogenase [Acidimicrobiia bacterium]